MVHVGCVVLKLFCRENKWEKGSSDQEKGNERDAKNKFKTTSAQIKH